MAALKWLSTVILKAVLVVFCFFTDAPAPEPTERGKKAGAIILGILIAFILIVVALTVFSRAR